jgi:anion-transporting  ArsA/GET3 family ATPase
VSVSMTDEAPSLAALLSAREVVVYCGSGGVGKTSVAAASALTAAARLGGKVLVLTIDPARRLADALGLEAFGNVARRVPLDAYAELGVEPRGELWAAMLDTKRSWDELVLRHAPDEATAYRILDNRMYHNVTSRFVQSHDYIAMERLYDIHASGEYDLIIIDTPPTRNAIDFLEAPARMAEFFGGRLLRWLTMPYRIGGGRGGRMFNAASRPFYQMADRVLGSQFLQDIAEFFLNFQSMYGGFVERAQSVEQLLHDRRTTFAVVTTLEGAPLREAETFCHELAAREFDLGALVLNKVLPDYLLSPDGEHAADVLGHDHDALARELAKGDGATGGALTDTASTARVLRTLADSFRNYEVVARREAELRTELSRLAPPGPEVVVSVPSFDADIADVRGLARIGEVLFAHGAPAVPSAHGGAGTIPP